MLHLDALGRHTGGRCRDNRSKLRSSRCQDGTQDRLRLRATVDVTASARRGWRAIRAAHRLRIPSIHCEPAGIEVGCPGHQ